MTDFEQGSGLTSFVLGILLSVLTVPVLSVSFLPPSSPEAGTAPGSPEAALPHLLQGFVFSVLTPPSVTLPQKANA